MKLVAMQAALLGASLISFGASCNADEMEDNIIRMVERTRWAASDLGNVSPAPSLALLSLWLARRILIGAFALTIQSAVMRYQGATSSEQAEMCAEADEAVARGTALLSDER